MEYVGNVLVLERFLDGSHEAEEQCVDWYYFEDDIDIYALFFLFHIKSLKGL